MHLAITVLSIGLGFATFAELSQQQALIERREYQHVHYGNFKAFLNHSLNVSIILATVSVHGPIECAFACLENATCFSFNFAIFPDINSKQHACHLLSKDKYRNPDEFVSSQQFHHYAIPSPCESFPCKYSGRTCVPLYNENDFLCDTDKCNTTIANSCSSNAVCVNTTGSFECHCKPGFAGDGVTCNKCHRALGMESGEILDSQINASSQLGYRHDAQQGRLNFQEFNNGGGDVKAGAWVPQIQDVNQWLQVDLHTEESEVTSVATQGRNLLPSGWYGANHSQWVTSYKLQYSNDGHNFEYYSEQGQGTAKQFAGNVDRDSVVTHALDPQIKARYIRFQPTAWHSHIAMRVELYGC